MDKNELSRALEHIKAKYTERLKEDQSSLEYLCSALSHEYVQDEAIDEIRSIAHRLAGISGALGFDKIQQAASILDRSAHRPAEGKAGAMNTILEHSKALVLEIKMARESSENLNISGRESSE